MTQTVPSKSTANVFYQGTARPRVPQAVLSQSTGRPYYPRMDNIRPRTSSFSPSTRSSTTRTPHRPQRPKKIMKSIWVKKESTVGSQAVLPQNVSVKGSAMINPTQTWRPKGAYLDSVNRDNGSYTLKQFEYGNPEEDLKDYAIIDSGCSGSMTGDKDKLSDFKELKGGYVAFGNDPKGGRIMGKGTIKTSCIDFEKVSYVDELKSPNISFMRPFGCPLTILNTLDHLGKFDGKSEEGYLLGYSTNSKGFRVYNRVTRKVQDCLHVIFLENQENQKGKGPDWMFDLELLTPSMNYIPVRKENNADLGEKVSTYDDVEDLDAQQFIVHGPSINTVQHKHSEERTADKEVPLSFEEQALHDELVSLMHQESLAKLHNDAQRNAFEKEKKRIALEKGKECVDSTFTLNTEEGGAADYNNMDPTIDVTSTPTLRIHKIHPQSQIIGKSTAGVQTRRKLKESASDQHQALLGTQESLSSLANEIGLSDASRTASTQATKYGCQKCILYGNITEEVYVKPPPGFEDPAHPNKGLQSIKALWLYIKPPEHGLRLGVPRVLNCFKTRHNVCCLSVCKVSSHSKEAFLDSDYAGDNHDRRSTLGGCQYLGRRLVSWQCKKQTIVAISS
ncbi:putative ribonuclease H-like domain-containing protein [Tanacetum coccineum]